MEEDWVVDMAKAVECEMSRNAVADLLEGTPGARSLEDLERALGEPIEVSVARLTGLTLANVQSALAGATGTMKARNGVNLRLGDPVLYWHGDEPEEVLAATLIRVFDDGRGLILAEQGTRPTVLEAAADQLEFFGDDWSDR